jgi:hypothetical protein
MADHDDVVPGTIVGFNIVRQPTPIGRVVSAMSVNVRLPDGREVPAELDLPPLEKPFMIRTFRIGSAVKVNLGTVREPIRVVEIEGDPA